MLKDQFDFLSLSFSSEKKYGDFRKASPPLTRKGLRVLKDK